MRLSNCSLLAHPIPAISGDAPSLLHHSSPSYVIIFFITHLSRVWSHGYLSKFGFASQNTVANSSVAFCFACKRIGRARKLVDGLLERDVISWNSTKLKFFPVAPILELYHGYMRCYIMDCKISIFRVLMIYLQAKVISSN